MPNKTILFYARHFITFNKVNLLGRSLNYCILLYYSDFYTVSQHLKIFFYSNYFSISLDSQPLTHMEATYVASTFGSQQTIKFKCISASPSLEESMGQHHY